MLNLRVLWRWAAEKEVATYWYEYPINPVKSGQDVTTLFALDDAAKEKEGHDFHATLGGAVHALNTTLRTLNDAATLIHTLDLRFMFWCF
jgi:hypothetical protein